jgi:DNA-directed RNA polymerase sigma subunit (sigma70/sigma32)
MCGMVERVEQLDLTAKLMCALNGRERRVVVALYGLDGDAPLNQKELAAELGVTAPRVWQVYHRAISKMRNRAIAY